MGDQPIEVDVKIVGRAVSAGGLVGAGQELTYNGHLEEGARDDRQQYRRRRAVWLHLLHQP